MKLCDIHMRDPFILNDNGMYYLYGTRGNECHGKYTGLDVYTSYDLENWSEPKVMFIPPQDFPGTLDAWAPEVHKFKDKYYCFVSFKGELRRRGTYVLVSDRPEGPFIPTSTESITPSEWECLDGTLYVDKEGIPYMVFCHEWEQVRIGEICAMELSEDLSKAEGEPFLILKADEPEWADGLDMLIGRAFVTDGPFLHRTDDGKLLMIWSSFSKGNYVEAIACSDNGEIDGNWYHADKLLFEQDGGHGMLFKTNEDELMIVMHYPNTIPDERPKIAPVDLYEY